MALNSKLIIIKSVEMHKNTHICTYNNKYTNFNKTNVYSNACEDLITKLSCN